jgi:hypothetical protein
VMKRVRESDPRPPAALFALAASAAAAALVSRTGHGGLGVTGGQGGWAGEADGRGGGGDGGGSDGGGDGGGVGGGGTDGSGGGGGGGHGGAGKRRRTQRVSSGSGRSALADVAAAAGSSASCRLSSSDASKRKHRPAHGSDSQVCCRQHLWPSLRGSLTTALRRPRHESALFRDGGTLAEFAAARPTATRLRGTHAAAASRHRTPRADVDPLSSRAREDKQSGRQPSLRHAPGRTTPRRPRPSQGW